MKLVVITIVLDGMPWIQNLWVSLTRWDTMWFVAHGAAMNNADQRWMAAQEPRLSSDGTAAFLASTQLSLVPARTIERPSWPSKTAMVNALLDEVDARVDEEVVLMQCDADEVPTGAQLEKIVALFDNPTVAGARFWHRYWLGNGIYATSEDGYGNRRIQHGGEWLRAWRYRRGMRFITHEPPNLAGNKGRILSRTETLPTVGLIDHFSWATEAQVAAKQRLYGKGYERALEGWRRLQENTRWPVDDLREFLPWVGPGASAHKYR